MKRSRSMPLSTLLPIALSLTFLAGCTPPQELIKKMLAGHLEKCKSAEGDFAEIKLFGGEKETILKETCEEPVTELMLEDKIKATAKVGPYTWLIGQNPDSGVWVVSSIEWREMSDARRVLKEDDPDVNTLEGRREAPRQPLGQALEARAVARPSQEDAQQEGQGRGG